MKLEDKMRTGQYFIDQETGRIQFNDVRFYYHEGSGDYFPSVTTVLGMAYPKGPEFFEWLKQKGEDADAIRDEAGVFGSIVHGMTEEYDAGLEVGILDEFGRPKYSSKEWKFFEKYVEFSERTQPEILHIETNLVSAKYKVGGTLDRILVLDVPVTAKKKAKKKVILDIKTSNNLHDTYWLQLVIYKRMWEEQYPEDKIDDVCILWLNAKTRTDGKGDTIQGKGWQLVFPPKEVSHYEKLWDATRLLFDEQFGDMKPNHLSYKLSHKRTKDEPASNPESVSDTSGVLESTN